MTQIVHKMLSEEENFLEMNLQVIDEDNIDNDNDNDNSQRCFAIIPSLFRKRSNKYKPSHLPASSSTPTSGPDSASLSPIPLSIFPINHTCLAPGSPISPRVKNFNSDMRELAASRADNPYITQTLLDRSNSLSSVHTTHAIHHSSNNNNDDPSAILLTHGHHQNQLPPEVSNSSLALLIPSGSPSPCSDCPERMSRTFSGTGSIIPSLQRPSEFFDDFRETPEVGDEPNLHDKLVRSPPPHFPERLSQFLGRESLLTEFAGDETLTVTKRH